MNEKINVRHAVEADAEYLAANIRKDDLLEITALGLNPYEAFLEPLKSKISESFTAEYEGRPMCMFGVYKNNVLSDNAIIWMLGTEDVGKCARELITVTRQLISASLLDNRELFNYVDYRYKKSLRWLKHLGFSLSDPEPLGVNGELFTKVSIVR